MGLTSLPESGEPPSGTTIIGKGKLAAMNAGAFGVNLIYQRTADHPANLDRASVPELACRVIAENAISETETEVEKVKSDDQPTSQIEEEPENPDTASVSPVAGEVIAPVVVRAEELPNDQLTPSRISQKPKEGDCIRNPLNSKLGAITKVNKKGLAKYEIKWDGGKTEFYSQKEFNKFDLKVLHPHPQENHSVYSQPRLLESWEKYYRQFKVFFRKNLEEFGYNARIVHPSGAEVDLQVPVADQQAANAWILAVLDAELDDK